MKFKKIIHHLLLSIGIALGIIATGSTINAKAQQTTNVNNENLSNESNQPINDPDNYQTNNFLTNQSGQKIIKNNEYPNESQNDHYSINSYSQKPNNTNNLKSNNYLTKDVYSSPNYSHKTFITPTKLINQANKIYRNVILSASKTNFHQSHTRTYKIGAIHQHKINNQVPNISYRTYPLHHSNHDWFRDGLNQQNLKARSWVSWHESNHRWNVLSYGKICVGYFQLSPSYLGYRNGHVNLNKRHQVKVADSYVRGRYGNWINAKRFWETHHWY